MTIPVIDPFGAVNDKKMPFLKNAIHLKSTETKFNYHLNKLTNENGIIRIKTIRVTRYKPGRRCLIEYNIEVERKNHPVNSLTVLGKCRARGLDKSTYNIVKSLWNNGFGVDSKDGISVPEPIGVIPEYNMWLQYKVSGTIATTLLPKSGAVILVKRIAEAINKLHHSSVITHRRHTIVDELSVLHERLASLALVKPNWNKRLERLLHGCERIGSSIQNSKPHGIHRDFYSNQLMVDRRRFYLLDLDLYCNGDPALDVGNFLGHITEQSLCTLGNPDALLEVEQAMEDRFVELSGEATRQRVQTYKTLTLARHIYLSTQFPERHQFTENLLELCEHRLRTLDQKYTGKAMYIVLQGKLI